MLSKIDKMDLVSSKKFLLSTVSCPSYVEMAINMSSMPWICYPREKIGESLEAEFSSALGEWLCPSAAMRQLSSS